ncbi:unnamed protein product [Litomosoides sigmodontis]|uniref:Uncharacterized protein n=1 Tax=Litomosoides sigmodontis TaxID=42156 RepID=A0A3P6TE82_LITSI|nr:unnamed protein product [Litomosoides sigmodontis]
MNHFKAFQFQNKFCVESKSPLCDISSGNYCLCWWRKVFISSKFGVVRTLSVVVTFMHIAIRLFIIYQQVAVSVVWKMKIRRIKKFLDLEDHRNCINNKMQESLEQIPNFHIYKDYMT